ncbi:MAG: MATE family efflux transporter [Clostridia bacterium]|nr:MATE family efflux transporter [Clostridia bacterium]
MLEIWYHYKMRIIDSTNGPIPGTMMKLAWPIAVTSIINVFYNIADTFFVGQLENSKEAIAAVSLSFSVVFLLVAFAIGISTATSTLISQFFGAGDHDRLSKTATTSLIMMILLAVVVIAAGLFSKDWIFRLLQADESIIPLASEYFSIIIYGMLFMFMFFVLSSMLRGVGDTKTPMIAGIVSSIINIVLDPFLIYGWLFFPKLGVAGAAYATVFARLVLTIYLMYRVLRKDCPLGLNLKKISVDFGILKEIFRIGIPSSISEMSVALGMILIVGRVNIFGAAATAAHGLGGRFESVMYMPMSAIGQAAGTMVGQNLGAKKRERAWGASLAAVKYSFISSSALAILFVIFARPVASAFTTSSEVIELSRFYIYFVFSFYGFMGMRVAMLYSFYGAGDSRTALMTTLLSFFVLRLPFAYAGSLTVLGVRGVWLGMGIAYAVTVVFMIRIYKSRKWMEKALVLREDQPIAVPAAD